MCGIKRAYVDWFADQLMASEGLAAVGSIDHGAG